jgi:hypothetical protein
MIEMMIIAGIILAAYGVSGSFVANLIVSAVICILLGLVGVVMYFLKKKEKGLDLIKKSGVFLVLCFLLMGYVKMNKYVAEARAEKIASACQEYKAKNNVYPGSLKDLVPDFMAKIPSAKYTIMWGGFHYLDNKIIVVHEPFFATPAYDLAEKKWVSVSPLLMYRDLLCGEKGTKK